MTAPTTPTCVGCGSDSKHVYYKTSEGFRCGDCRALPEVYFEDGVKNPDSYTATGLSALTTAIHTLVGELGRADQDRSVYEKASLETEDAILATRRILTGNIPSYAVNVPVLDKPLVDLARERMNELAEAKRTADARQQTINELLAQVNELKTHILTARGVLKGVNNPLAEKIREALTAPTNDNNEKKDDNV